MLALPIYPRSSDNIKMSLTITQFAVGGFDKKFSYLSHDEQTKEALYIDLSGHY